MNETTGRRLFGRVVQEARLRRGLTQRDVATAIGMTDTHVSRIEAGEVKRHSAELTGALARALAIDERCLLRALGYLSTVPVEEAGPEWGDEELRALVAAWPTMSAEQRRAVLLVSELFEAAAQVRTAPRAG